MYFVTGPCPTTTGEYIPFMYITDNNVSMEYSIKYLNYILELNQTITQCDQCETLNNYINLSDDQNGAYFGYITLSNMLKSITKIEDTKTQEAVLNFMTDTYHYTYRGFMETAGKTILRKYAESIDVPEDRNRFLESAIKSFDYLSEHITDVNTRDLNVSTNQLSEILDLLSFDNPEGFIE